MASKTARGPTTRRTSRWGRSATLSLVAFLAWPTLPVTVGEVPATYSAAVRANVAEPDLKPAKIVILVDESGSISPADMVKEQEAAGIIAQAEFSKQSTVAVVGFASDNGRQSPVDVVCPPIVVAGAAERDHLSECVRDLKKRDNLQGSGTDHAEAVKQALSYLSTVDSSGGSKIVFLLTDGVLDVSDSPRYGANKSAAQRNEVARSLLGQALKEARDSKVSIWPLGFGKLNKTELDNFAIGGFPGSCGPGSPSPSATVVFSSADVDNAILRAYSAARCAGIGPIQKDSLASGQRIEVPVTIPPIATDGSIVAVKHDSRIAVEYVDPNGHIVPKSGAENGSNFEVSGETGAVEALRIVNPVPGRWFVRLTSTPDVPAQNVSTTVTWQGAVQASIEVDPPSPAAGQVVTVSMRMHLRGGAPVTDPVVLRDVGFAAELTGDGFAAQPIALANTGRAPDTAPDGTYTGQITIPKDVGASVTVVGHVHGIGISGDDPVAAVRLASAVPQLLAAASLPTINDTVAPGASLPVKVSVTNNSGQHRKLRLVVEQDRGATITIPATEAVHDVDTGNSTFDFHLAFSPSTQVGTISGAVSVVDDASPSTVIHRRPFTANVAFPPKPFPWLLWVLGSLGGLLLLGAALFLVRLRQTQEVQGLVVHVFHHNERAYPHVISEKAKQFPFRIGERSGVPELTRAQPGDSAAYVLTRSRSRLHLKTPSGEDLRFQLGDARVKIGPDFFLRVDDEQKGTGSKSGPGEGGGWNDDFAAGPTTAIKDPML